VFVIDRVALTSPASRWHPGEKLIPAFAALCLALSAREPRRAGGLFIVYAAAGLILSGAGLRVYSAILAGPAVFIATGALGLAVGVAARPPPGAPALDLGPLCLYWSAAAGRQALLLGLRALAATAALLALVTTTTVNDLLRFSRRLGVPAFLVELASLVYRYIAVLWETAERIRVAQTCRQGYRDVRASFRSLASLAAATFRLAWERSEASWAALRSRGYDGSLLVRSRRPPFRLGRLLASCGVLIALAVLSFAKAPS
jgi:cobalt/nickel transport system permease protein